jgi:hypothetical protein
VARLEWSLRPPPGYRVRPGGGSARPPGEQFGSITFGVTSAEVKATWNLALDAYQDNRFDEAGDLLATLGGLDPENDNARRLQSNIDALSGKDDADTDEAQVRRIREMARAKEGEAELAQRAKLKAAEEKLQSGDVEAAMKDLAEVEALNRQLAWSAQEESGEVAYVDDLVSSYKAEAKRQAEEKAKLAVPKKKTASKASPRRAGGSHPSGSTDPAADGGEASTAAALEEHLADLYREEVRSLSGAAGETPSEGAMHESAPLLDDADLIDTFSLDGDEAEPSPDAAAAVVAARGARRLSNRRGAMKEAPARPAVAPAPLSAATGGAPSPIAMPPLAATTFAIPLPEHAEPLLLVQQLLPPGETPSVQIKYREIRR